MADVRMDVGLLFRIAREVSWTGENHDTEQRNPRSGVGKADGPLHAAVHARTQRMLQLALGQRHAPPLPPRRAQTPSGVVPLWRLEGRCRRFPSRTLALHRLHPPHLQRHFPRCRHSSLVRLGKGNPRHTRNLATVGHPLVGLCPQRLPSALGLVFRRTRPRQSRTLLPCPRTRTGGRVAPLRLLHRRRTRRFLRPRLRALVRQPPRSRRLQRPPGRLRPSGRHGSRRRLLRMLPARTQRLHAGPLHRPRTFPR